MNSIVKSIFIKFLLKKDVYGSREQCTRPIKQCIIPLMVLFSKKKKNEDSETQNAWFSSISKQILKPTTYCLEWKTIIISKLLM